MGHPVTPTRSAESSWVRISTGLLNEPKIIDDVRRPARLLAWELTLPPVSNATEAGGVQICRSYDMEERCSLSRGSRLTLVYQLTVTVTWHIPLAGIASRSTVHDRGIGGETREYCGRRTGRFPMPARRDRAVRSVVMSYLDVSTDR